MVRLPCRRKIHKNPKPKEPQRSAENVPAPAQQGVQHCTAGLVAEITREMRVRYMPRT